MSLRRSASVGVVAACVVLGACSGSDDGSVVVVESSGGEQVVTIDPVEESTFEERDDEAAPVTADEPTEPLTTEPVAEAKDIVTRSPDAVDGGVQPQGDPSTVTVRITSANGEVCDVCMWLADSGSERSTGLMGVTDLGGPVGMAFSWDAPTDGRFFMLGTPTPLSIAWFAESGDHVGQEDMTPCLTDDSSTCERYGADAPYDLAIEMFEGQFEAVGIAPGARAELVAGSESPDCLLAD